MRENISGILVITGCNKPAANEKQFSDSRKNSCFEAVASSPFLETIPDVGPGVAQEGTRVQGRASQTLGDLAIRPTDASWGSIPWPPWCTKMVVFERTCVCTFNRFITLQDLAISQFNFVRLYASATLAWLDAPPNQLRYSMLPLLSWRGLPLRH